MSSSSGSSRDGMSLAKTLIRTCVRTFHATRQILIIDALFTHSVLHADDLAVLLSAQPKDVRRFVAPLRFARLLATHSKTEARVGTTRGVQREYYYIPLHPAVDAIKYKITRLRKRAEQLYQVDNERKDWRCLRCKAEWTELEVLDNVGEQGFLCHRCGYLLEQTEEATKEQGAAGGLKHEKIRRLNAQLGMFDRLIERIDAVQVPENRFEDAWAAKVDVPRTKGAGIARAEYVDVGKERHGVKGEGPGETDASRLNVHITSGAEQEKEEEERKEERRKLLAKQNQLPEWHTTIAGVKNEARVKAEDVNGILKKEDDEDKKKPDVTMDAEVANYLAEMEREKEEEARKAAEEDAETPEAFDGDDEDGEFEDVVPSGMGTPMGSQSVKIEQQKDMPIPPSNGLKRESDFESGPSSEANTPAGIDSQERAGKRIKLENGVVESSGGGGTPADIKAEDSEEDEDFEDAM